MQSNIAVTTAVGLATVGFAAAGFAYTAGKDAANNGH